MILALGLLVRSSSCTVTQVRRQTVGCNPDARPMATEQVIRRTA
jgi:hypothetical protein